MWMNCEVLLFVGWSQELLASFSSHCVDKTTKISTCIEFTPINLRQQLIKMAQNQLLWTKQHQFCERTVTASWVKALQQPCAFLELQLTSEVIFAHQLGKTHLFLCFSFLPPWGLRSPRRFPPFRPFSSASLNLSVTAYLPSALGFSWQTAQSPGVGIPQARALLSLCGAWRVSVSTLYLCYCFSGFPLVASPHPNLCLPRGIKARG